MVDAARIAAYYDAQAAQYDATMDREPRNVSIRAAFQALVAECVPAGSRLLDFGCGTGLDAAWYAQHGYRVVAYDPSPGMIDRLVARCAGNDRVVPVTFPFAHFPATIPKVDAIVANFAVLNLVPDARDVFARWARVSDLAIVSVLNPLYWRDMGCGWWWRGLAESWHTGALRVEGAETASYRHYPGTLRRAARPDFTPAFRRGTTFGQFTFYGFRRA